jgi:plasmid stabilization system protein ParE
MVGRAQAARSRITSRELAIRPRALAEIQVALDHYVRVGHGEMFLLEIDRVLAAIDTMPRRFPVVDREVRRALVRRYPYAVFFRIHASTAKAVVLAVLDQRMNPARWPR